MKRFLLLFLLLLAVLPHRAGAQNAMLLGPPVDCSGSALCFVQNHFDRDPGPGHKDYRCGPLTYDGHTGTDIRVSYADMLRGVPVLAVADGVVLATRDGVEDLALQLAGGRYPENTPAGNGVLIDHNGGLETQYSHLRKGSVLVRPGEYVRRGQPIGMVGLSGKTEFPHVEVAVRIAGQPVDPYGGDAQVGCGVVENALWDGEAATLLAYQPHGVLGAGVSETVPTLESTLLAVPKDIEGELGEQAVAWLAVFGARQGDALSVRLLGPENLVIAEHSEIMKKDMAQRLVYAGVKTGKLLPILKDLQKFRNASPVLICEGTLTPADPALPPVSVRRVIAVELP